MGTDDRQSNKPAGMNCCEALDRELERLHRQLVECSDFAHEDWAKQQIERICDALIKRTAPLADRMGSGV